MYIVSGGENSTGPTFSIRRAVIDVLRTEDEAFRHRMVYGLS